MHVKKGDNVYIMAGKDKGKTGKILRAYPSDDKVLVEGMNKKKVHQKGKKSGEKGTTVEKSFPVHVSNVRLADKPKAKDKTPKAPKAKESKAKTK